MNVLVQIEKEKHDPKAISFYHHIIFFHNYNYLSYIPICFYESYDDNDIYPPTT